MNKKSYIKLILLILFLIVIITYIFRERLVEAILLKDLYPRNPKNQIETTYNIGWWSHQDDLQIDSLSIKIIESKLCLFNSYSLISYTIKGEIKGDNNWKPFIDKIHLSERFTRNYNRELHPYLDNDSCKLPEAIFEITPIVEEKENRNYNGEKISFEFTNELKIESFHWGNNSIRFQCADLSKDIILKQIK